MAVQLVLCLLTAFLRPGGAELPVPRGLRAPCPPAPALLLPRGLTHRCREHPSPGGMEMVQGWDGTEREPPLSPAAHREHRKAHPRRTRGTSHERRAQPAAMDTDAQHTPARCCPALPCPALCQGLMLWAQRAPCCPMGHAGSGCSAALRCAVQEEVSAGIRVASRKGLIQSPRHWAARSSSPLVPPLWQHKQNLTVS